ncbi:hypothetical protein [Deinococcus aerophilus]|uniref:Uridine kinase n=1 Tax=Deinococcus aerophilus TaxID=522488 RepID=A0ABQ2GHU5_9DEIO|nr:hypothetical protein [Deinococcus aerophilus]GGL95977.1 hypothetical protein GCM10010841_00500 [Deinococcus aerophilus]
MSGSRSGWPGNRRSPCCAWRWTEWTARFADELADMLRGQNHTVIRASADDLHHPRAVRYRRGRDSPEGFYRGPHDLAGLKSALLEPLGPGGSLHYRTALLDVAADRPVVQEVRTARPGHVLLVDGLFPHRPELRGVWYDSIFLQVEFAVSVPLGAPVTAHPTRTPRATAGMWRATGCTSVKRSPRPGRAWWWTTTTCTRPSCSRTTVPGHDTFVGTAPTPDTSVQPRLTALIQHAPDLAVPLTDLESGVRAQATAFVRGCLERLGTASSQPVAPG